MERPLTAQGLADFLQCRRDHIYRLLSRDKNFPCIMFGARRRFIPEQVIAYLKRKNGTRRGRLA